MSKIDLQDVTTLTNETSFLSTINENNASIEDASDNFLSLDGTSPNSMAADLDMNSNRILNLSDAVSAQEPLTLAQASTLISGGTITTGAPFNASYVTLATNSTLTAERVLTAGTGITLTDAGAGSTITIANSQPITTSASLAALLSDETGTGKVVFDTSPTIATPTLTNPTVSTGAFSAPVLTSPTVTTKISPTTDDGAPLGDTTHQFSDLFLASGGVINFNAGDVTATHSSNLLTFAGATNGYTFDNAFGYPTGAGAGGTVTQATSKSTGVTLNKPTGEIVMNNATLNAGTIVSFSLTNSTIGAQDVLVLNHVTTGALGSYTLNAECHAGSAAISVRNNTAGGLSEAIIIRYALIKGSVN